MMESRQAGRYLAELYADIMTEIRGLFFMILPFAEYKFVVKKEIKNHNDD